MSHCPEIVLQGITGERYALLLATAKAQGLELEGESGSTSYQGMSFRWRYEAEAGLLTIQCTEKPIFVPCGMIEGRIRGLVG